MIDLPMLARTFARDVAAPQAAEWEAERRMAEPALRDAIGRGLGALLVPASEGGSGARVAEAAEILEILAAADLPFAFSLVVHNNLAAAIAAKGSDHQKTRYLEKMRTGAALGAFCLTEPGVGTDAAAIGTTARRDGDGWVIDGEKAWVTNAAAADLFSVYAQTDPGAGSAGIAAFLVERGTPGLTVEPAYRMLGCHSMGAGGVTLKACRVSAEAVLAPPGAGFRAAMGGIDLARVLLSAMCCGALRSGLDIAVDYTAERRAFGQPLLEFQGLQWMLADVATDLRAARLLTWHAAGRLDAGEPATVDAAHAKKFTTRAALAGLGQCMQAMGAAGFRADCAIARHFAAAKMAQYLDGATEVQNIVIARALKAGAGA